MILLISFFSFLLTGVNLTLGAEESQYTVAILPLLIPLLIFPLIEGVIIGIIIKDSLKWRARGWTHFFMGSISILIISLVYYTRENPTLPYDNLLSYVLSVPLLVFIMLFNQRIMKFYESGFRLIRVTHDLDKAFHYDGLWVSFLIAGSVAYWSLGLLDIITPDIVISIFFFSGINIWVLSALGARNWLSKPNYYGLWFLYPVVLFGIYLQLFIF